MALKNFKLVNVDGLKELKTRHGNFLIQDMTDEDAEKLFHDKSRYVQKIESTKKDETKAIEK